MIDWINKDTFDKHYKKHIINSRNHEKDSWIRLGEKDFVRIYDYREDSFIDGEKIKNFYEQYSKENVSRISDNSSYFVCKPLNSPTMSINYYSYPLYDENQLITCTQINPKDEMLKIHSCFFKINEYNDLDIFYFVKGIQKKDDFKGIINTVRIRRTDDNYEELYRKACLKTDFDEYGVSEDKKTIKFKANILIEYFNYLIRERKNQNDKYNKQDREDLLSTLVISALEYYVNGNINASNVASDYKYINYLKNETQKCNLYIDKDITDDDIVSNDSMLLYCALINFCNQFTYSGVNIKIKNNPWNELFDSFINIENF